MADKIDAALRPVGDRAERTCPVCGKTDTDPRIVSFAGDDVHFDCSDSHLANEAIREAGGNKAKLVKHLTKEM